MLYTENLKQEDRNRKISEQLIWLIIEPDSFHYYNMITLEKT